MIDLDINGRVYAIDADPDTPLLYVLRDYLALSGAKFGCGLGQCGACTVMVDGEARFSCRTPIASAERQQGQDRRGAGHASGPGAAAARFPRRAGRAVRLLQRRNDHAGAGVAGAQRGTFGGRNPPPHGAQPLPLRRSSAHPARSGPRRGADARGRGAGREAGQVMSGATFRVGVSRRGFLATGGALIVSFSLLPATPLRAQQGADSPPPIGSLGHTPMLDAWIRVDADGGVSVFTGKVELGQGIKTALIQIAAEQIGIEPSRLELVTADTARTPDEGFTSGSHSMQDSGTAIMHAAAQVREILLARAAVRLDLAPERLRAEEGMVVADDGRRVGFGALVSRGTDAGARAAAVQAQGSAYLYGHGPTAAARRPPRQGKRWACLCAGSAPARHGACAHRAPAELRGATARCGHRRRAEASGRNQGGARWELSRRRGRARISGCRGHARARRGRGLGRAAEPGRGSADRCVSAPRAVADPGRSRSPLERKSGPAYACCKLPPALSAARRDRPLLCGRLAQGWQPHRLDAQPGRLSVAQGHRRDAEHAGRARALRACRRRGLLWAQRR